MKKLLLLSAAASAVLMAGGDIAPVEPAVAAPAVETSGWDFSGQAVVYYQTSDSAGAADLFDQASSAADAGVQLRAVNKDIFNGVGAGVEVSGLTTLGLEHSVVSGVMEGFGGNLKGGWISQAYLTYAMNNTSFKIGRQELPKALSPFAFSEGWNVFKNTFDAALVVNTDIADTTLVGAWVHAGNKYGDMATFKHLNNNDGVYMLTAQNTAIENATLTGTYYYAPDAAAGEDIHILWGDAQVKVGNYAVAAQAGTIMCDALPDDGVAFGVKASASFNGVNANIAYSSTDENANFVNVGTGVKTPLYTQMILNQGVIANDADYIKVGASTKALNGTIIANYGYAINNQDDIAGGADNNPAEFDLVYKTKVFNDSTTLLAAYVNVDPDVDGVDNTNVLRFWARYNF